MIHCSLLLLALSTPIPSDVEAALWHPDVLTRDVAMLSSIMDLDVVERGVVAELIDQYGRGYQHAAEEARIAALSAATAEPADIEWAGQHQEWADIRAKAASMSQEDSVVYLQSMQEWAGEELEQVLRDWPAMTPSARRRALIAWDRQRQELRQQLFADLSLIFEEGRRSQLALADARLRLDHDSSAATRWALPLEKVDLSRLLAEQFSDGMPDELAEEVDQYVLGHARVVADRAGRLGEILAARTDAQAAKDHLSVLKWTKAEMELRQTVVDDTLFWYERLGRQLDDDALIQFQRRFNQAVWPEAFAPSKADRIVLWALQQDHLDPDLMVAMRSVRAKRGAARLSLASKERAASRIADRRRPVLMAEQQAMAQLFGDMALFGIPNEADERLQEAFDLAQRRSLIEASAVHEIRQLLGDQLWDEIPDATHIAPHQRRVLAEQGAPLDGTAPNE